MYFLGSKQSAGIIFTLFSSEYLNTHFTFQFFIILFLLLVVFLTPLVAAFFWSSLNNTEKNGKIINKVAYFLESKNNWKILIPFCYLYFKFFNQENNWSHLIAKISFVITVFGIFSRVVFLQHLTAFYTIPEFTLFVIIKLYPIVLINQLFTFSIALSIYIWEKLFSDYQKLKLLVTSNLIMRGILKDEEDINVELADNKQKHYKKSADNFEKMYIKGGPSAKPPIRPFWSMLRGNATIISAGAAIFGGACAGIAAYANTRGNNLLQRGIDQKDVELGFMSPEEYEKKYYKK